MSPKGERRVEGRSDERPAESKAKYKVFLSSTFEDLKDHRDCVIKSIRKYGFEVEPMEEWAANPGEPSSLSVERVRDCDLCILLVAYRRGFVPDSDKKGRSVTQMEYDCAVENGIDVLVFMLGEDEAWRPSLNDLDKDPGICQWREYLRNQHTVEFFQPDPESLKVAESLGHWERDRSPTLDARSVSRHLDEAATEISDDPIVREQALKFRQDFKDSRDKLAILRDRKALHDILHDLPSSPYELIVLEAANFPDERSKRLLQIHEKTLSRLVERMEDVTSRPSFDEGVPLCMEELIAAREELHEALEYDDSDKLASAIAIMKMVLATQPSKIATQLNSIAKELPLVRLAHALEMIGEGVSADSRSDKSLRFQAGAEELKTIGTRLHELLENHEHWQKLDDMLRLIEDELERDLGQLARLWPRLRARTEPLYATITDEQAVRFRAAVDELHDAITAEHPKETIDSFRSYRSLASDHFYDADKRLHKMCGELEPVGKPLDEILHKLKEE
jgi:hypothetical protein